MQPVARSRLVDISYSDSDPQRAQQIANAYADAYIASNIDKRFQANESAKIFLEDKIKQLKQRLAESDNALVAFAAEGADRRGTGETINGRGQPCSCECRAANSDLRAHEE